MDWNKFNTHGESKNHAFEVMCNLIFEKWCKREYGDSVKRFFYINGSGGDGGVEAYCELNDGTITGIQSKWFPQSLQSGQFSQIFNSFCTALTIRKNINKYIVCLPRDLTSKRVVSGGKETTNSENDKWDDLVEKCSKLYPNVEIILWSESTILSELQRPESVGSSKYWFDNSEILESTFQNAIEKAKNGWARTKYIPDVYMTGHIHDALCDYLDDVDAILEKTKLLSRALNNFRNLSRSLDDIKKYISNDDLMKKVEDDICALKILISRYESIKSIIESGQEYCDTNEKWYEFKCTAEEIKDEKNSYHKYFHFNDVVKNLEASQNSIFECTKFIRKPVTNVLIFLGNPGTGKTFGIVNETSIFLENKRHLPFLLSAKRVDVSKNWKDILIDYLGISNNWDENELFVALETAASLRYTSLAPLEQSHVIPKVMICVDGLDESNNKEYWITKINEAKAFENRYPNVKFVFLSRPSFFSNREDAAGLTGYFEHLFSAGDVDSDELLDKYTKYYNINIEKFQWVKNVIKTPLAVKLFCDLYKDQNLDRIDNHQLVITNLIEKKIEVMNQSFLNASNDMIERKPIFIALYALASLFTENERIDYDQAISVFPKSLYKNVDGILQFLEREGIIDIRADNGGFETVIYWGMQPTLDYLIAKYRTSNCLKIL